MEIAKVIYQIEITKDQKTGKNNVFKSQKDVETWNEFCQKHIGKFDIQISRQNRSQKQNKYYWFLLQTLSLYFTENTGKTMTQDYFHETCKAYFLGVETHICQITKLQKSVAKSTTKLTTKEFVIYTEKIRHFFLEQYQIILPKPDPNFDLGYL